jgi:phenylalanyl-tRNA synthetase beta chain
MKLSREWLKEFTDISAPSREYAEKMSLSGSKVEGTEELGAEIINVVAGKVISIEHHENSDHLWVCQLDVGRAEPVQIVTGAQNVRAGDLVPVALHKSTLPGGVKIEKGKLRGVKSEGMLCSLGELNLTVNDYPYADADGIFIMKEPCVPGQDIREVLGLNDSVVDFEITNNRPDCLSVIGLARESAVTFGAPLRLHTPEVKGSGDSILNYLDVDIENPQLCPRYTARYVKNVKIAPSPEWMRRRLRASGVRPINNIVDITNYVMLEYGQPMHSFDYSCISGSHIIVRNALEGEQMSTLDGTVRTLSSDMLVIADETRAIALAGIMGGENSEIKDTTKAVVFEAANFNGTGVRKTALKLAMRTDSSSRFEKGLDPLGTLPAVERACELVELLGAGEVVDGVIDVIASDNAPTTLKLEPERINKLLGTSIPRDFMVKVLCDLGFTFEGDIMTVPSWRADVSHYSDVAEEVARFYGYDVIEATSFKGSTAQGGLTRKQQAERSAAALCRSMGFNDILTYSFMGQSDNDKVMMPADHGLRNSAVILNPLGEDTSVMRTTMLPSLMECLGRNYSYRNKDVKLFELSKVYLPVGAALPLEKKILALGLYGQEADFFILKGYVEAILGSLRINNAEYKAASDEYAYHPGRCAYIYSGAHKIGLIGEIHPKVTKNYGIALPVCAAELDFDAMFELQGEEAVYKPLPRFPAVLRDLALVCNDEVTVGMLSDCIKKAAGSILEEVSFFDIYKGASIAANKKSVAFSLRFRLEDRSLSDEDINPVISKILLALDSELGAKIR